MTVLGNTTDNRDIVKITDSSITCNQNSSEDFPKLHYNHHEKDHSSSSKNEPTKKQESNSKHQGNLERKKASLMNIIKNNPLNLPDVVQVPTFVAVAE